MNYHCRGKESRKVVPAGVLSLFGKSASLEKVAAAAAVATERETASGQNCIFRAREMHRLLCCIAGEIDL